MQRQVHKYTTVAKAKLNKACIEFAVKLRHETAKMGIVIEHWVQPYMEQASNADSKSSLHHTTKAL